MLTKARRLIDYANERNATTTIASNTRRGSSTLTRSGSSDHHGSGQATTMPPYFSDRMESGRTLPVVEVVGRTSLEAQVLRHILYKMADKALFLELVAMIG